VLCGYASALYDDALRDWMRLELPARADGGHARTEILWINPQAVAQLRGAAACKLSEAAE
jgi:DNA adenine methylase